ASALSGHRRHAKRCALLERHMIGQFADQVGGKRDAFSRGSHPAAVTLPVVEPYPLAEPALIYSRPDLIDDPGTVAVGDDPGVFHGRRAAPSIGVRRIDAGSLQLYPHLAVAGVGRGQFAADQWTRWFSRR